LTSTAVGPGTSIRCSPNIALTLCADEAGCFSSVFALQRRVRGPPYLRIRPRDGRAARLRSCVHARHILVQAAATGSAALSGRRDNECREKWARPRPPVAAGLRSAALARLSGGGFAPTPSLARTPHVAEGRHQSLRRSGRSDRRHISEKAHWARHLAGPWSASARRACTRTVGLVMGVKSVLKSRCRTVVYFQDSGFFDDGSGCSSLPPPEIPLPRVFKAPCEIDARRTSERVRLGPPLSSFTGRGTAACISP
jgi:hypothetical protein